MRPSVWSICKGCGARVYFVLTEGGSSMPVDVDPTPDGNVVLRRHGERFVGHVLRRDEKPPPGVERRTAHWATCTKADAFRRVR